MTVPLVGHERARATLARAHARDTLPAALLLHGARGVGKQRLALWLGQLLVCQQPSSTGPCDACRACRMALTLEHPDLHWYFPIPRPKGASGDKLVDALEEARHQALAEWRVSPLRPSHSDELRGLYLGTVRNIRARAHKRPTMAAGPVFVIGEAELLAPQEASQEAANALLKLLEEPPGAARFILTSNEPGSLLETLRSRTVPVHVGSLAPEAVTAFLREHAHADPGDAARAAALGQGSVGRALGFLPVEGEPGPLEALRWRAFELVGAAAASGAAHRYATPLGFPPSGARTLLDLFAFVEEWLRDLAAVASGVGERIFHADALDRLRALQSAAGISAVDVPLAFAHVERARELARANVNPQLIVAALLRDLNAVFAGRGHALATR